MSKLGQIFSKIKISGAKGFIKSLAYPLIIIALTASLFYMIADSFYLHKDEKQHAALEKSQRVVIEISSGTILSNEDVQNIKSGGQIHTESKPAANNPSQPNAAEPTNNNSGAAMVSIVISHVGEMQADIDEIINMPAEFVLSFSPYTENSLELSKRAYEANHEVIIDLPMQSSDPTVEPGNLGLKVENTEFRNIQNLRAILGKVYKASALLTDPTEIFSQNDSFIPVMKEIAANNKYLVYTGSYLDELLLRSKDTKLEIASIDMSITGNQPEILAQLKTLESKAKKSGYASATIPATSENIGILLDWYETLPEKNLKLVPNIQ